MEDENSTFDLLLAIPCAVSHKNKKNIKKYVAKHKLLDNVETRFDNLVKSLNLNKEDKDEHHKYFARKYKPILKKLRKNPREKDDLLILATAMSSYESLKNTGRIKNEKKDNAANLLHYAKVFCNQLAEHSDYELMFNDTSSNIKTERTPILFGQVNIYKDCKTERFKERCAYNFFCVLSELTIDKDKSFKNDAFNIVHFVVPDITYCCSTAFQVGKEIHCPQEGKGLGSVFQGKSGAENANHCCAIFESRNSLSAK